MYKGYFIVIFVILLGYSKNRADKELFHADSDYLPYDSYRLTLYFTIEEKNFSGGSKTASLKDKSGKVIKTVTAEFNKQLLTQKNGKLVDGSFLHVIKNDHAEPYVEIVEDVKYGTGIKNYQLIPYRSVRVNPREILPGSVLFIPQVVGTPLPDGTFHDGYFLAHDIIDTEATKTIGIYLGFADNTPNKFRKSKKAFQNASAELYLVHGVMEKVINMQYESQYQRSKTQKTYRMTWKELEKLMHTARENYKEVNKRIEYISECGKGTPYLLFHLGEGADSDIDLDPLIDFGRTDCMTFCEHVLAMAISNNYRQMYHHLQQIRYKDGNINFFSRNHYTVADWLPNNSWLLYDATEEIGDNFCSIITKTIDRKKDFLDLGIAEEYLLDVRPIEVVSKKYIPAVHLLKIKDNLLGGEITCIITSKPGIFSTHMGIIIRDEWNNIIFRHASSLVKNLQVIDQRFEEIVDQLKKSKTRVGMLFIRVKKDTY